MTFDDQVNGGPIRIVNAGIPLLDGAGPGIMDQIHEGDLIEVHDGALWRDGEKIAVGELLAADEIEVRMEDARRTIGVELQRFARNTLCRRPVLKSSSPANPPRPHRTARGSICARTIPPTPECRPRRPGWNL